MKNFEAIGSEASVQKIREPFIFFDRKHAGPRLENKFGKRTKAGSYFHHIVVRRKLRPFDNPAAKIAIMQEILPQRFDWRDPDLA